VAVAVLAKMVQAVQEVVVAVVEKLAVILLMVMLLNQV
jgi:hypothetical protein